MFVAIKVQLDPEMARFVGGLNEALVKESVRWVDPVNYHVTLHFFGNIDEEKEIALNHIFENFAAAQEAFEFGLKGVHFFGKGQRPRVLFIDICNGDELGRFARRLKAVLLDHGMIGEQELAFRPHLTIARLKSLNDKTRFSELVESVRENAPMQKIKATEITFYESQTKPGGPIYKPQAIFKLQD